MVRASMRSTSSAQVLVQSWGHTEGAMSMPRGYPRRPGPGPLWYTRAMSDERPKTAYELAMERLARKDQDAGGASRPLTDAQKAAIAEARQLHQSRVAEREILHQAALRKAS